MERWARAMKRQVEYWSPRLRDRGIRIETAFFGGGTPSLLPNDILRELGETLRGAFDWSPGFEWSVECNPETLDREKLGALRDMGATRLSMGLQSFQDAHLERLERRARRGHNLRALELVARDWSGPWSGDLMFGLPGQSLVEWEEDLALLLGFGPGHVSAYQLTLTTERAKNWRQPGEERLLEMFDRTEELCAAAGLPRYEVSNFARPGRECRHNLRYWKMLPFLGLGPGAAGVLPPGLAPKAPGGFGAHQRNPESFEKWEAMAGTPREELALTTRSPLEHAEEILLMGLRLPGGVELERFGPVADLLETLPQDPRFRDFLEIRSGGQALENKRKNLAVTEAGLRILDGLFPKIFELLESSGKLSPANLDSARFDTKFSEMSEFTENPADFKEENGPAEAQDPAAASPSDEAMPAAADGLAGEAALEEWKNKVSYLAAEIENMRKRFVREKTEVVKYANEELIKTLLPVVDNLFLAVKAMKDSESKLDATVRENSVVNNLFKGVDMTLKHFESTLEQIGVKAVHSEGQAFDPTVHEAVGQASDPTHKDNHISSVLQRGWTLHGRVIRPARVFVNKLSS